MKRIIYLGTIAIAAILGSCENKNQGVNQEQAEQDTVSYDVLAPYSERFRTIYKVDTGVFRGINFGMTVEEVQSMEGKTPMDTTEDTYLSYLFPLNELEEAEAGYYYGEDKRINKIQLNIYSSGLESQTQLFAEIKRYYISKFGKPAIEEDREVVWDLSGYNIFLRKLGNRKVQDIQVDFLKDRERPESV
ncbi:MAG: hypothetical protein ACK40G_15405 [Cytophagaceae bacterium]